MRIRTDKSLSKHDDVCTLRSQVEKVAMSYSEVAYKQSNHITSTWSWTVRQETGCSMFSFPIFTHAHTLTIETIHALAESQAILISGRVLTAVTFSVAAAALTAAFLPAAHTTWAEAPQQKNIISQLVEIT